MNVTSKNIKQRKIYKISTILLLLIFISINSFGQSRIERNTSDTIVGDVVVVKAYSPAVSDVNKIQFTPKVTDTVMPNISFKYYLRTSPAKTHYDVIPIHAAKILPEPLTKLYDNCLKAGFGSYATPLAEYCYSSHRSKEYSLNVHLKHESSTGKIKLNDTYQEKAYLGYSNNLADINSKFFFKKQNQMQFGLRYDRNVIHNYGFNTALLPDTLPDKSEYKQRYWSANMYLRFLNSRNSKSKLNYNAGINYNFMENLQKSNQHTIELDATLSQYHNKELIGGDLFIGAYAFNNVVDSLMEDPNILIEVKPWVKVKGKKWNVKAGLDIVNDHYNDSSFYHFYPNVMFNFNLVEDYFSPYVGVQGKAEVNHYYKLIQENPFVSPNIMVKNTNHMFIGIAGLKGKFSQKLSFDIGLNYSIIDDAYFFVNDTSQQYDNLFIAETDDVDLLTLRGQIYYDMSKKLRFLLKGEYYSYTMSVLDKAWHKPDYVITFSTYYNIRDKFVVRFDVFALGEQYAKNFYGPEKYIKLDGMIDVNLGVEYRYNKRISTFVNFNNIISQKYQRWNQYPTQGFNAHGGLMFSF
jgi:hypothetical protein